MGLKTSAACVLLGLTACAHGPSARDLPAPTPQAAEAEQNQMQIAKLNERMQDLEARLSALNDKINLENGQAIASDAGSPRSALPLPTAVVTAPAAHGKIIPKLIAEKKSKSLSESSETFSRGEAIDRFREAKILFDTQKYSDAVLEFSEFVKNQPEHPLAAAAQYYVGLSYVKQKEYKLGEEELSRGLLAYAHSNYVPDTLAALIEVSERLNKVTKVTYYREKLQSHFANSPQAKKLSAQVTAKPPVPMAPSHDNEPSVISGSTLEGPVPPTPPTAPSVQGDTE